MDDRPMFDRINELAREEEQLWETAGDGDGLTTEQTERLETIRTERRATSVENVGCTAPGQDRPR